MNVDNQQLVKCKSFLLVATVLIQCHAITHVSDVLNKSLIGHVVYSDRRQRTIMLTSHQKLWKHSEEIFMSMSVWRACLWKERQLPWFKLSLESAKREALLWQSGSVIAGQYCKQLKSSTKLRIGENWTWIETSFQLKELLGYSGVWSQTRLNSKWWWKNSHRAGEKCCP